MKIYLKLFTLIIATALTYLGTLLSAQDLLAQKMLRFTDTEVEGLAQLQRQYRPFQDLLSKTAEISIELFPVPNRMAAVGAIKSAKVDLVLTGPAEYVVFKKLTNAIPVVALFRPNYFCDLIVLVNSGITSVKDLKGKKMALGTVGSTSRHLAPMQIIADNGLNPQQDIQVMHTSIELGWEALKRGDVAAFGTGDDRFQKLLSKETTFKPGDFTVIARSPNLPNDVLLAGPHVPAETIDFFRKIFLEHNAELVTAILQGGEDAQKYQNMKFLTNVKDSDYDDVRKMYKTIGFPQFSEFLGKN